MSINQKFDIRAAQPDEDFGEWNTGLDRFEFGAPHGHLLRRGDQYLYVSESVETPLLPREINGSFLIGGIEYQVRAYEPEVTDEDANTEAPADVVGPGDYQVGFEKGYELGWIHAEQKIRGLARL